MQPAIKLVAVLRRPAIAANLLEGLSWTQGANTILSIADGFARATRNGANPRIYKLVNGLSIGATYQLGPNRIYLRNSTNVVMRVTTDAGITASIYDSGLQAADTLIDTTFVATATSHYIGLIGVNSLSSHYVECDENFRLEYVSG